MPAVGKYGRRASFGWSREPAGPDSRTRTAGRPQTPAFDWFGERGETESPNRKQAAAGRHPAAAEWPAQSRIRTSPTIGGLGGRLLAPLFLELRNTTHARCRRPPPFLKAAPQRNSL